ncbi:hypothetical protein PHMEG_00012651 [Phytophthora megakarya]|uniref:Uncharacterized protein n=1 Tax=Phytophthora megakarya TaxID=4795 RepID=A0A225W9R0_9STRA|nr:hypothetical protein PHMEG_00012651 [Phytophthora megakarya]
MATPIIHVRPTATQPRYGRPKGTDALSTSNRHAINATTRTSPTVTRQHRCQCHEDDHDSLPTEAPSFRRAPSDPELRQYASEAKLREAAWDTIRLHKIKRAHQAVGLELPWSQPIEHDGTPPSTKPSRLSCPNSYGAYTFHYQHLSSSSVGKPATTTDSTRIRSPILPGLQAPPVSPRDLQSGVQVPLRSALPPQSTRPANRQSARNRYNVLVKNIRKEHDAWRCFVVDDNILRIWSEVHVCPFGVLNKGDSEPQTTGRVIHDLSDFTNSDAICELNFEHCDAIATEIMDQHQRRPDADIKEQAGDVASAYCVYLFGGRLDRDRALIIHMAAAFGWSGSPGNYGSVGGAIAFIHGHTTNSLNPSVFFNYH